MSTEMRVCIHVECPLLLSDFYQNLNRPTNCTSNPQRQDSNHVQRFRVEIAVTNCLPHNSAILIKYSPLHNNIKNDDMFGPCRSSSGWICYKNINRDVQHKVYTTKTCKRRLPLRICSPGSFELLWLHIYFIITQPVSFSCFVTPIDRRKDSDFSRGSKGFNCF